MQYNAPDNPEPANFRCLTATALNRTRASAQKPILHTRDTANAQQPLLAPSPLRPQVHRLSRSRKQAPMHEPLQIILAKSTLTALQLHVGKSGLSIGDSAGLSLRDDGQIGVLATLTRYRLGLLPYRSQVLIGLIPLHDRAQLLPHMANADSMRVRVVALTPEHLAPDHRAEIAISVWGIMRFVPAPSGARPPTQPAPPDAKPAEAKPGIPPPPPFRKISAGP